MMYSNKLAVAVKNKGKVLREFGDQVVLPFGDEYSIQLKNMNSVRASVSIEIDGNDISDGSEFVVGPNESLDIERFLRGGNMKKGNKFKFIERTSDIENHKGIGVEDGLVRVEFKFEKIVPPLYTTTTWTSTGTGMYGIMRGASSYTASNSVQPQSFYNSSVNDAGITAPGSESDQQFQTVASFPTESESHVIVLKLVGQTKDNVQVQKAVDVNWKPECVSCGRKNKANAKFCGNCGTALTIIT